MLAKFDLDGSGCICAEEFPAMFGFFGGDTSLPDVARRFALRTYVTSAGECCIA